MDCGHPGAGLNGVTLVGKAITAGAGISLARFQDLCQFFPLSSQRRVPGLVAVEFLRPPLAFLGTDKILQLGLEMRDRRFGAVDLLLQLVDAILHLLALDGVQPLPGGFGPVVTIPTSRNIAEKWGTPSWHRNGNGVPHSLP